ncbi:uncharacterized protein LOC111126232 [Crassostrea virginica]
MASKVTTQGQEAVVCDLCRNPVSFFCRRCGVSLCDSCVPDHLRISSKVGHDVVDFTKKGDGECSVFCKMCDLPICKHKMSECSVNIEEVLKSIAQENGLLQSFRRRKVLEVPSVSSVIDTGFPADEQYKNNRLLDMAVTNDQKVWVGGASTELKLFDLQGRLQRTVTITTHGMYICMYNKQLMYTDGSDNTVKKISDDDTVVTMFTTGDWIPNGIIGSAFGDLLVCLRKDDQSKVVRYSSTGTVLQEIQYVSQGQPLYQRAWYIAENVNGDIIVTDFKNRKVIVVDILGIFRYTYSGRNNDLDALSVATDSVGHVYVTDFKGNKIHMLDRDGRFLRYIIPEGGIKYPRPVCMIGDGEMIVGECLTGLAKRIKLLE